MRRLVPVTAIVWLLALAPPAVGKVRTYTLRYGPIAVGGFRTVLPRGPARTPHVDGSIVAMHARVVDRHGRPVTIRDVMMHHVYFMRRWHRAVRHACQGKDYELFYGTGEEDQTLRLPAGYGYRIHAEDRWRVAGMLMSHDVHEKTVYLQYRITVDTRSRLTPVRAFWLRANGCPHPGYFIYGGGAPGSTDVTSMRWRVPYDLRIVAAGGHLHAGARNMWLSQPRCGGRRLLDTRPAYGMPDDLYYRARPILHEPGPVDTRFFMSHTGIQARKGEVIRLSAAYDAEHPRMVMAVMHLYVARERRAPKRCARLPGDRRELRKPGRTRSRPPWTRVPLTGLNRRGHTYSITSLSSPAKPLPDGARVEMRDSGYAPQHISLAAPGRLTWRAAGSAEHNVRLADGPRLVATPTLTHGRQWTTFFGSPGRYTLFCTRHPVTMHAVVDVGP